MAVGLTTGFVPKNNSPGLHITIGAGHAVISGSVAYFPPGDIALAANSTTYIYLNYSSGHIESSLSGFLAGSWPICTAFTTATDCQGYSDLRPDAPLSSSGGSGTPGGSDKQVQFNQSGAFGGDANLLWDYTNHKLTVGPTTNQSYLTLQSIPILYAETTSMETTGAPRGPFTIPYDFSTYLSPASASAVELFNINALVAIKSGCAQNFTSEICGIHAEGDHNGTGTVAVLIGASAECYNLGNGIVTHLSGSTAEIGTLAATSGSIGTADAYQAVLLLAGGSTITNMYGFHVSTPTFGVGSMISGTVAAIQIDDITGGGIVTGALGINISTAASINNQLGVGNTTVGALTFNNATIGAPSSAPAIRCGSAGNDRILISSASTDYFFFNMHSPATNGAVFNVGANGVHGWSSGNANNLTSDTGLSRVSAGVLGVGNGTQGDVSATVQATLFTGPLQNTNAAQLGSATGSVSTPTYAFLGTNGSSSGMLWQNGNGLGFSYAGAAKFNVYLNYVTIPNGNSYAWAAAPLMSNNPDTGISRISAGVVGVGNGTGGNVSGTLEAATVQFSTALVSLGGGAAPTLGTIGGTGPATAAQNSWLLLKDSGGNSFWVPVWK